MRNLILLLFFLILSFISSNDHENNWAILAAGSEGYWNYRHQADVYHAYQILLKGGYNPDHIIVFAQDDIENNTRNPFPGKVFNKKNGEDVYSGVKIDYKGQDNSGSNFIKVLTGDKQGMTGIGTGRVLESTSKDNIFIYFSDHGGKNMIWFP